MNLWKYIKALFVKPIVIPEYEEGTHYARIDKDSFGHSEKHSLYVRIIGKPGNVVGHHLRIQVKADELLQATGNQVFNGQRGEWTYVDGLFGDSCEMIGYDEFKAGRESLK